MREPDLDNAWNSIGRKSSAGSNRRAVLQWSSTSFAIMKNICAYLGILSLFGMTVLADEEGKNPIPTVTVAGPFDRGVWELEGGAGEFGSFATSTAKWETINYQLEDLRVGWMYDSPRHAGWLRGNNEFLLEAFGGPVTKGPGSYLVGGSPLWRYNFVQPGARLVPYIQLGMGALYNNIYRSREQSEIGQGFEFALQGGIGLKYLLNDRWAISAEVAYRHISNGGMTARNQGLNSIGGLLLVSYIFH